MALCKKFLDAIKWPTILAIYGEPGTGKTNIALEFVRHYCLSSCLYIGTTLTPIIERMKNIGIRLGGVKLQEIIDYLDLVDALLKTNYYELDLIVVDPITAFAREGGIAFNATLFTIAALRSLSDSLGIPVILVSDTHIDPETKRPRPLMENAIYFWAHSIARIEQAREHGARRLVVERPLSYEALFRITERGIEWLTC